MKTEVMMLVYNVTSELKYKEDIEDSYNKGWYVDSWEVVERGVDANNQPAIFVAFFLKRETSETAAKAKK